MTVKFSAFQVLKLRGHAVYLIVNRLCLCAWPLDGIRQLIMSSL